MIFQYEVKDLLMILMEVLIAIVLVQQRKIIALILVNQRQHFT